MLVPDIALLFQGEMSVVAFFLSKTVREEWFDIQLLGSIDLAVARSILFRF